MIQAFYTQNNRFVEIDSNIIQDNTFSFKEKWISLINPTDKEIDYVAKHTQVPEDILKAALDEEERARIEVDDGATMVLVDVPTIEEEDDYYSYNTLPMAIILKEKYFITVTLKSNAVVRDFMAGRAKNVDINKCSRLLFQFLYNNSTKFLQYLRLIDKSAQRIQNELNKSLKNRDFNQLLDLENSLVYFSTSIRANDVVIDRLNRTTSIKKYEEDLELLDDVLIENRQAMEMCNTLRDILSSAMMYYTQVISNNLNTVMKLLTAVTFIIAVPTFITGLFGMNVSGIPGQGKYGFWIVTAISLGLAFLLGWIMYKKKLM